MNEAGQALQAAKAAGKNRAYEFDSDLESFASRARAQRDVVRSALNDDAVVMHFQPVMDLETDEIVSVEAFVRCISADLSIHEPKDFLEAIANSNLMAELDYRAFDLACTAAAELKEKGLYLPFACNFAPHSLRQPNFVSHLERTARSFGLDPLMLHIEITEAAVFDRNSVNIDVLRELAKCGFTIVLDDFGAGASALAHLRDLPIDVVKIDRVLTQYMTSKGPARAVALAITQLANSLGLRVIVEGVETEAERNVAAEIGAHYAQGWHFAATQNLNDLVALAFAK